MSTESTPSATRTTTAPAAALEVEDLEVVYTVRGIDREVLRGVSFSVAPGEAYGLVGESGCGKSTTAYAALRYLPSNGKIVGGHVRVGGRDLITMSDAELQEFRAREASMVYQDPAQAMNPTLRVGRQIVESFTLLGQSKDEASASALEALRRVRIADPARVMDRYPFQLSGGMQQRVVIAMALACNPKLLVLDEPTTGLDATVEAEVLDLVRELRHETGAAVLMIAHNLGIIRSLCDRVGVMYAGKMVEEGPSGQVFDDPQHPYTVGLLRSLPRHGVRKTERALSTIPGTLPMIGSPLPTCVYVDRCPIASDICRTVEPPVVLIGDGGRFTRCHHPDRLDEIQLAPPAVGITVLAPSESQPDVLELTNVSKTFHQRNHDGAGTGRRRPRARRGRDTRHRRRVGFGQVHTRQDDARHRGRRRGQRSCARRHSDGTGHRQPHDEVEAIAADGVPEPRLGTQPQLVRAPHPDAQRHEAHGHQGRRGQRPRRSTRRAPPTHTPPPRPQAASALGRSQAARCDRPGIRRRPTHRRLRRAHQRARRVGAGGDPQPARRAADPRTRPATCSSPTTWASCGTSPTGSP